MEYQYSKRAGCVCVCLCMCVQLNMCMHLYVAGRWMKYGIWLYAIMTWIQWIDGH
jgi:hypothetical protein